MTTPPPSDRGKKRSREEEKQDPPSSSPPPATQDNATHPADTIAHFLATHSPPPKLARTTLPFASSRRPRPPPASDWPSLPVELVPLVCQHFSSWRDLLRLCRVHRCFDTCIRRSSSAAVCWKYVSAVRLRIDGTSDGGVGLAHRSSTVVSINHRQLSSATVSSSSASDDEQQHDKQLRRLFLSLQFVPRLSWSGRLDYAAPLLSALTHFTSLRHLHVHSLSAPGWPDARPPYMQSMHTAFRSLVSLTLDNSHAFFIRTPSTLLPLSIRYLSATIDFIYALLMADGLASSALASSLVYVHCGGSTHWLPWSLALLPNLQHLHAGEKTSVRFDQRFVSHKRPVPVGGSGGSGVTECGLLSYAVRQSEEWVSSRLTFPSLVCLLLHGKELLELQLLLTLSELPSLRQLTLSRRAAWSNFQEERDLPPASMWLPQLAHLDYLDIQCEQSIDSDWLTELLFACIDADTEAAMVPVRRRLRHLALQLPRTVDEEEVRGWRLAESSWPALQHCCLAWTAQQGASVSVVETRNVSVTEAVVGAKRACRREALIDERVDRQWISSAGVEEWK